MGVTAWYAGAERYNEARSSMEEAKEALRSWDDAGPPPGTWLVAAVVAAV